MFLLPMFWQLGMWGPPPAGPPPLTADEIARADARIAADAAAVLDRCRRRALADATADATALPAPGTSPGASDPAR